MGFWENWNRIRDLARRVTALEEGGGGGGLPPVTSADNGDVLTVVEGSWNKAEPIAELPEVTSADNDDILKVVSGVWSKATPTDGLTVLWRNLDIDTDFEGQTIALDLSEYDAVIITFTKMSSDAIDGAAFILVGLGSDSSFVGLDFSNQRILKRTVKSTAAGVVFGDCSAVVTYTQSTTPATDNSAMIPHFIFGIKGIRR